MEPEDPTIRLFERFVASAFMRVAVYLAILLGLFLLADATRDEYLGVTSGRRGKLKSTETIRRADDPAGFRQLMARQWFRGSMVLFISGVLLGFHRRAERLDPMAPDVPKPSNA